MSGIKEEIHSRFGAVFSRGFFPIGGEEIKLEARELRGKQLTDDRLRNLYNNKDKDVPPGPSAPVLLSSQSPSCCFFRLQLKGEKWDSHWSQFICCQLQTQGKKLNNSFKSCSGLQMSATAAIAVSNYTCYNWRHNNSNNNNSNNNINNSNNNNNHTRERHWEHQH